MKFRLALILFIFSLNSYSKDSDKVYSIGFYNFSREPLVIIDKGFNYHGVFAKAIELILSDSKIKYELEPLPKIRARRDFWTGESVISCCDSPNWRKKPQELEVQLFSEPFLGLDSVYVTKPGVNLNNRKLRYALVNGFSYNDEKKFRNKSYVLSELKQLEFVARGRADVAILDKYVAKYFISKHNLKLEIKSVFEHNDIHIRVHKNAKHLLPLINKSILKLKSQNKFQNIIKQFVGN